jgi:glycosyltransferase involved in cell wall biosynthesis
MKVALIHDHLIQDGGAEYVLRVLQDMWPDAPTYTLLHDKRRAHPAFLERDIRTSFLQKIPGSLRFYKGLLPWMPHATERHNLSDFDLVVSSSSGLAKGVITRPETLHVSYCHTPTRYLWSDTHSYVEESAFPRVVKSLIPFALTNLRLWDRLTADRVDRFIANSNTVRARIWKYYRREADVIPPPVDLSAFSIAPQPENFYLIGGRLVPYKRFDIAIKAFSNLGIPLKVFGEGPILNRLKEIAKPNIEFLGRVSDAARTELYQKCTAFLHPHEEDFGITAIEAMASGRPVIAYAKGGALETVIPGVTGKLIHEQAWEVLADTVIRFEAENFDPIAIRSHALQFDIPHFRTRLTNYIASAMDQFQAHQQQLFEPPKE